MARRLERRIASSKRLLLLAGLLALVATPLLVPASAEPAACPTPPYTAEELQNLYGCTSPTGDQADEAVKAVKASLLKRRSSLTTAHARLWLDRAVQSLDIALAPSRYGTLDRIRNNTDGQAAVRAMRTAIGRLYWVDTELRSNTRPSASA